MFTYNDYIKLSKEKQEEIINKRNKTYMCRNQNI